MGSIFRDAREVVIWPGDPMTEPISSESSPEPEPDLLCTTIFNISTPENTNRHPSTLRRILERHERLSADYLNDV